MDVAGAAWIYGWFHGAEEVIAVGSSRKFSDAPKIGIAILNGAIGMNIGTVVVCLPDFNQGAANRAT